MKQAAEFNQDDALGDDINASFFAETSNEPKIKGKFPPWLVNSVLGTIVVVVLSVGLWNMFGKRFFGGGGEPARQMMRAEATRPAHQSAPQVGPMQLQQPQFQPPAPQAIGPEPAGMDAAVPISGLQGPMTSPAADAAVEKVSVETANKLSAIQNSLDALKSAVGKIQTQVEETTSVVASLQGEVKAQADARQAEMIGAVQGVLQAINILSDEVPKKPGLKTTLVAKADVKPTDAKPESKPALKPDASSNVKPAEKSKPAVKDTAVSARTSASLRGILDERATLQLRNGESVSLVVGDAIPGSSVTVSKVDADRGEVTLSDGTVLK